MRRHRVWIVAIVVGALVFAQAAVAAHACALLSTPSVGQTVDQSAQPMHSGCTGMAAQSHSTVNVCVSHCAGSDQSNASADIPTAAVAPQPALNVRVSDLCILPQFTASTLVPPATAPPPQLLFVRFLI